MGKFEVNLPEMRKSAADMLEIHEEIKRLANAVKKIRDSLPRSGYRSGRKCKVELQWH